MEVVQIRVMQFCRKLIRWQILQILPESFYTLLAETAAILEAGNRKFSLIQLDPIHPGIDLNADDGLQIFTPDWVVAIHHITLMLAVRSFDPTGMAGLPVNIA